MTLFAYRTQQFEVPTADGAETAAGEISDKAVVPSGLATALEGLWEDTKVYADTKLQTATAVDVASIKVETDVIHTSGYHSAGDGGSALYYRTTGSFPAPGIIRDTTGALFRKARDGDLSLKQVGGIGDGIYDNKDVFAEAISLLNEAGGANGGARILRIPNGDYRTTETVLAGAGQFNIRILGESRSYTKIIADHDAGPVMRIQRSLAELDNFQLLASSERQNNALYADNAGLWLVPPDVSGGSVANVSVTNIQIQKQPGDGVVHIGGANGSFFRRLYIEGCGGHGYVGDRGKYLGYTNEGNFGLVEMYGFAIYRNGGHALMIGHPDDTVNPSVRYIASQMDIDENCLDDNVIRSEHQVWMAGANNELADSAFGPHGKGGGVFLAGNNNILRNNRIIGATHYVKIGITTGNPQSSGNIIGNFYPIGGEGHVNYDPAIIIDSVAVNGIIISPYTTANVNSLVDNNIANAQNWNTQYGNGNRIAGTLVVDKSVNTKSFGEALNIIIPDDGVASVTFLGAASGFITVKCRQSIGRAGECHFQVNTGSFISVLNRTNSTFGTSSTYPLTGTTGDDGNVTVAVNPSDNELQIENRSGLSRMFSISGRMLSSYITGVSM